MEVALYLKYNMEEEMENYKHKQFLPRRRSNCDASLLLTRTKDQNILHEARIHNTANPREDVVCKMFCDAVEIY